MLVNEQTLVATENVREAVALILDAAVAQYGPENPALAGVETALAAILSCDEIPAREAIRLAFRRRAILGDVDRLNEAVEHARLAFWNQFAACYPEVASGDLDPLSSAAFDDAATDAAREWLRENV